jgi:hypothetical protein
VTTIRDVDSSGARGATTRTGTIAVAGAAGLARNHRWTLIAETPSSAAMIFCEAPAAERVAA